jgi:hypothetical protein
MTTSRMFWHDRIVGPIQALSLLELDLSGMGLRNYTFPVLDGEERWTKLQLLLEDIKALGNENHPSVAAILETLQAMAIRGGVWDSLNARPLDASLVSCMVDNPWCHIGLHGHEHNILTTLNSEDLRSNLRQSKEILQGITRQEITLFAYPNGSYNKNVVQALEEFGFIGGFTTVSGRLRPDTNRHLIPRIEIGGYDTVEALLLKINKALLA